MEKSKKILALFSLLIIFSLNAWSDTFLIETKYAVPRDQLVETQRLYILGAESGLMEILFDMGHIFFNIHNEPDAKGQYKPQKNTIKLAIQNGTDYLIMINPDEVGIKWSIKGLNSDIESEMEYLNINLIQDIEGEERWYLLGKILGEKIMEYIH